MERKHEINDTSLILGYLEKTGFDFTSANPTNYTTDDRVTGIITGLKEINSTGEYEKLIQLINNFNSNTVGFLVNDGITAVNQLLQWGIEDEWEKVHWASYWFYYITDDELLHQIMLMSVLGLNYRMIS
jgi:hypothetical protein